MTTVKATAHRAGALYFVVMLSGIASEFLLPDFRVPGDAAATARAIEAAESMYRVGILVDLIGGILFLQLVAMLYHLLKDADRSHALLMVLLVVAAVGVSLASLTLEFAPLVLLGGTDYLSVFTPPQLEALALGSLTLSISGTTIASAFWGLWLFPFGVLVIRSGYFPRLLGILLIIAGCAYVVFSAASIVLPAYRQALFGLLMPLFFGEVPIILWMMVKGARIPSKV